MLPIEPGVDAPLMLFEAAMISIALILGAPVIEPQGNKLRARR
jgi:hypothetical protein